MASIKITGGKGVHFEFDNGWVLSVQFGPGNYGSNRWHIGSFDEKAAREAGERGATAVEIAAWRRNGQMIDWNGDSVKPYVPVSELFAIIEDIRNRGQDD